MNQIISFKEGMIPLILEGKKTMTTRLETPFRLKMDKGDIIYIYSGIRTKEAKKHGEAIVLNRWQWNQSLLWECYNNGNWFFEGFTPFPFIWESFSKQEGFLDREEMYEWFSRKQYKNKNLITYQFEVIK